MRKNLFRDGLTIVVLAAALVGLAACGSDTTSTGQGGETSARNAQTGSGSVGSLTSTQAACLRGVANVTGVKDAGTAGPNIVSLSGPRVAVSVSTPAKYGLPARATTLYVLPTDDSSTANGELEAGKVPVFLTGTAGGGDGAFFVADPGPNFTPTQTIDAVLECLAPGVERDADPYVARHGDEAAAATVQCLKYAGAFEQTFFPLDRPAPGSVFLVDTELRDSKDLVARVGLFKTPEAAKKYATYFRFLLEAQAQGGVIDQRDAEENTRALDIRDLPASFTHKKLVKQSGNAFLALWDMSPNRDTDTRLVSPVETCLGMNQ